MFSQKKVFLIFPDNGAVHFSAKAWKMKEIHPRKISYTARMGNPEKLLVFPEKKDFLIYQETGTLKKFLYFR